MTRFVPYDTAIVSPEYYGEGEMVCDDHGGGGGIQIRPGTTSGLIVHTIRHRSKLCRIAFRVVSAELINDMI